MSWEPVVLAGICIIFILLMIFRNTPFVKTNWKYFIILIPLVVLIVLKIMSDSKNKGGGSKTPSPNGDLGKSIEKLKDKLEEAQMESAIEISGAKTKNGAIVSELEEIKKIEDKTERRKRLAAMIG